MRFASKFLIAALALATCLPATAQTKAGTFKLPYATRWNHTIVPAGDYSIAIYSENTGVAMLTPVDPKLAAVFLVPVAHDGDACDRSSIKLRKTGAEWSVHSVCLAEAGLTLYFAPSAQSANMVASANRTGAAGSH